LAKGRLAEPLESRVHLSNVPAPLTSVDVGTPTGGSASYDSGTGVYTVVGAGHDIRNAADAFHYVYTQLTGDGTVVVQVDSDSDGVGDNHALAGLDIRSSLSPTAANMFVAARDDASVFTNDRLDDGDVGNPDNTGEPGSFPELLELIRTGNDVQAYYSTDGGANYTLLTDETINFPSSTVLVGMAVASQEAPSVVTTATFQGFSVVASNGATATLTNAPTITGPQVVPYDFTVNYASGVDIDATTIGNNNVTVTLPGGSTVPATLVSTGLTDSTSINAVYSVSGLSTTGLYQVNLGNSQVDDTNGNFVSGGSLGSFTLLPDLTPPTATLISAPTLVASTTSPYQFTVSYNDNDAVNALRIGNNNWDVVLPDGSVEATTLVSTGLTSGPNITAVYQCAAPLTNGIYTIETSKDLAADVAGNEVAAGTLGTFDVAVPNTIEGTVRSVNLAPIAGAQVFLDLDGTGVYQSGDPTTTTGATGSYSFTEPNDGTYDVVQVPPAGQQVAQPSGAEQTVSVDVPASVASDVNFIDTAVSTPSSAVNLVGSFRISFASAIQAGHVGANRVRITNTGSGKATGKVTVSLLLSTDSTLTNAFATLKTFTVSLNLKSGQHVGTPVSFQYPADLAAGTYHVIAVVDSSNVIAETNKLDNIVAGSAITVTATA
jgi:hypothetical protein